MYYCKILMFNYITFTECSEYKQCKNLLQQVVKSDGK